MKKYKARFMRAFEAEFDAASMEEAQILAKAVVNQFPEGSTRLLSIYASDYVAPVEPEKPSRGPGGKPTNKPPGGSPGTPTMKLEPVMELIAKAA